MATIRILLGIICLVITGRHSLFSNGILESRGSVHRSQQMWCIKESLLISVKNFVPFEVENSPESEVRSQQMWRFKKLLCPSVKTFVPAVVENGQGSEVWSQQIWRFKKLLCPAVKTFVPAVVKNSPESEVWSQQIWRFKKLLCPSVKNFVPAVVENSQGSDVRSQQIWRFKKLLWPAVKTFVPAVVTNGQGSDVRSQQIWRFKKLLWPAVKTFVHAVVENSQWSDVRSQQIWPVKNPLRCFAKNSAPFAVKNYFTVKPSIISIAQSQIGVREATGQNDGLAVENYLRHTGNQKGAPWCAAFVSWVFGQAGYLQPKTAWSPALFPQSKRTTAIKPATVFGIYFPELKRIAHCGFIEQQEGHWLITIEGNTNMAGSREGDGVYRKRRLVQSIKLLADWTKQKGGNHAP